MGWIDQHPDMAGAFDAVSTAKSVDPKLFREAMSRLEADGLIVLRPRRGYAVTSLDQGEILEILRAERNLYTGEYDDLLARRDRFKNELIVAGHLSTRYGIKQVRRYVEREQPLDCAGSFKSEALGISLCQEISSTDPTALVGLPLIALVGLLGQFGVEIPEAT